VTRRGWLLFAAMGLIWGIPYLLIKIAVAEVTPASLVFLRTAIGALVLVPVAAFRDSLRPLLPQWRWLLAYTAIEVAIPWFLLSDAERHISSSFAGLLVAAVPFVGALLAWLTGGDDRPDARRVVGLVVGFVGVAALVGLDVRGGDSGAIGEVAVVTVCYAVGPMIIARRLAGVPSVGAVAASLALTAVAYAPVALGQLPSRLPPAPAVASIAFLGIACTAIAFILLFALVAEVGPARAMIITYVNPAVALALGVAVLSEPLTPGIVAGFALILLGSFLATQRARRPGVQPARSERIVPLLRSSSTDRD
jgi:drug/metabolite transporter (DMT)-like permease